MTTNKNYTVAHMPEEPHDCDTKSMFVQARYEEWPDYTIIECEDCGESMYFKRGGSHNYIRSIGWWNRKRVEKKAGLR